MKSPEHLSTDLSTDLATGSKPAPGDLAYVQGFVNTIDLESGRDAFATPAAVAEWLSRHGLAPDDLAVDEDGRERVIRFREALRDLLLVRDGAEPRRDPTVTLQAVAAAIPFSLRYGPDATIELEPAAAGVDGALGRLQAVIYRATLEGTWQRLKICGSDTCLWAFYDASRNRSGAWCSMEVCGNRTKVRAHRERKARGGDA